MRAPAQHWDDTTEVDQETQVVEEPVITRAVTRRDRRPTIPYHFAPTRIEFVIA